jgi:predicted transposase YbfD/YdcC
MPLENGIASLSTASRLLSGIDEELFALEFMEWAGEIIRTKAIHIVIDGKALRASTDKVKGTKTPMVMNAIDAATGFVLAQLPIQNKECEITEIPKLLKYLEIAGNTVTIDAIGTQTQIMRQIVEQKGHFVLTVKRNQPMAYDEIMECFKCMSQDREKMKADPKHKPRLPEMQEKYDEVYRQEKNRERYEHRWYRVCNYPGILTRSTEDWPFIETVGQIKQVRIPIEKDEKGNDITPDLKTFQEKGSKRKPKPTPGDGEGESIQEIGIISDMKLTAEEMGKIKRNHWTIENRTHHVLDDTFREDRSPAGKSKNNLALIRKFSYNILRIAMLREAGTGIMTEMMDDFCDNHNLIVKYIFEGIENFC